jgi:hypothetical protein
MDAPDDLSVFRLLNERGKDIYTKRRVFQEGYTSSGGGYESWLEGELSSFSRDRSNKQCGTAIFVVVLASSYACGER